MKRSAEWQRAIANPETVPSAIAILPGLPILWDCNRIIFFEADPVLTATISEKLILE